MGQKHGRLNVNAMRVRMGNWARRLPPAIVIFQ